MSEAAVPQPPEVVGPPKPGDEGSESITQPVKRPAARTPRGPTCAASTCSRSSTHFLPRLAPRRRAGTRPSALIAAVHGGRTPQLERREELAVPAPPEPQAVREIREVAELFTDQLARVRIAWSPAVPPRHLVLNLRRERPAHPQQHAVRVLGVRGDHPRVRPTGRTLLRDERRDRTVLDLQQAESDRPSGTHHHVSTTERLDRVREERPVQTDERGLPLEQVRRGLELRRRQRVRIVDSELWVGGR